MEDVIGFETGLLLESFDIPYYFGIRFYNYKRELNGNTIDEVKELVLAKKEKREFNKMYKSIPAFRQTYIQKWLREKYNLNINIKHKPTSQTYGYSITGVYDKDNDYIVNKIYHKFETYESALEDALLTCLSKDENGEFMYIKLEK